MLMDENALASMPRFDIIINILLTFFFICIHHFLYMLNRPGTSLRTPAAGRGTTGYDPGVRPVSSSGRPLTGFARPNTNSRPMTGSFSDALDSSRMGTSARPATVMGREIRLGTASLTNNGTSLVDMEKLNVKKYCTRKGWAMIVAEYLLYVQHNTRKALELCAEATKANDFKDWWWKAKLGKCYMKLGMLREAEMQLRSSIKQQPIINTYLELCNLYIRFDVPNTAIEVLIEAR